MKVVILGSGNVGTHLGRAFIAGGNDVLQVYSRRMESATKLAGELGCAFTTRTDSLNTAADVYVIAVTDDAIADLAARFPLKEKLLVHTSGTTPMDVLQTGSSRIGVFYPLQTFSKEVPVSFRNIPVCLEAAAGSDMQQLEILARSLTGKVYRIDSTDRQKLHVAAVFACNFVNHMYAVAADILEEQGLPFDLLRPLIEETARKVMTGEPDDMQTGPARRKNQKVLDKHSELLAENPEYRSLYVTISKSILKKYHA